MWHIFPTIDIDHFTWKKCKFVQTFWNHSKFDLMLVRMVSEGLPKPSTVHMVSEDISRPSKICFWCINWFGIGMCQTPHKTPSISDFYSPTKGRLLIIDLNWQHFQLKCLPNWRILQLNVRILVTIPTYREFKMLGMCRTQSCTSSATAVMIWMVLAPWLAWVMESGALLSRSALQEAVNMSQLAFLCNCFCFLKKCNSGLEIKYRRLFKHNYSYQ